MHLLDWVVMLGTMLVIVAYGIYRTRDVHSVKSYLLGDRDLHWSTIGLSIMATQASAITFLSTPGQAYESGMGFAQFYFGLPIAMVILAVFVLPIYYRLNVYTAYEYLEGRFNLRTRTLTALLFLVQRGLAAGITIYAPAIILSAIMGWDLNGTILFIGVVVIFYTVLGGTKAVSVTQKQQMFVILTGMMAAAIILVWKLPADVSFSDAVGIAGKMGKLQVVDFEFDLSNRYNFWSGMLGGTFLFLSYFGTDQSQVQRYLSGKSLTESRLGLLFNGILKVPMQFLILFIGVLVFVFFQFNQPPLHFNESNVLKLQGTQYEADYKALEAEHATIFEEQRQEILVLLDAVRSDDDATAAQAQQRVSALTQQDRAIRTAAEELMLRQDAKAKTKDTDYIFITFVTRYMPIGLVGLLLAVILSAAMSSTSSELNALATTTVIDLYKRSLMPHMDDHHYFQASRLFTVLWGAIALGFAMTANLFDNLIQAVNIIGSLFYGAILGIFVVAFGMKHIGGRAVFKAAIIAESLILLIFAISYFDLSYTLMGYTIQFKIAYLWLNLIGCVIVVILAQLFEWAKPERAGDQPAV